MSVGSRADAETLAVYQRESAKLAAAQEQIDPARWQQRLASLLGRGRVVLELGAGSGRDAAWMVRTGATVIATDAVGELLREAGHTHRELRGRLLQVVLPAPLPIRTATCDGVLAMAVLMHLETPAIIAVLAEVARVLKPGGWCYLSVPARRDDVGSTGRDPAGRRFNLIDWQRWTRLLESQSLAIEHAWEEPDAGGRAGVTWRSWLARRTVRAAAGRTACPDGADDPVGDPS